MAAARPAVASEYHARDFLWEELRDEAHREISQHQLEQQQQEILSSTTDTWEKFHYLHREQPFFKERRYIVKEFPELLVADREVNLLEVGCGTGSSVVPVLRANGNMRVYACDCSKWALRKAIELVHNSSFHIEKHRFIPFSCDVCADSLPWWLCCPSCSVSNASENTARIASLAVKNSMSSDIILEDADPFVKNTIPSINLLSSSSFIAGELFCCIGGMDIVMLIFTLSSIPPKYMEHVIQECFRVLKPGGLLVFRDYGLYDMTMRRFLSSQRVGENLYQRGDGTLSYFFTVEVLRKLFAGAGFSEKEISYCCVEVKNRKKLLSMKRVWVHAKFLKPMA